MSPKSQRHSDARTQHRATNLSRFKTLVTRHRHIVQDVTVLLVIILVATFLAFEFDIYANQDGVTRHEETIELDEALSLGGVLCIGLLIFAFRRYNKQKQGPRRRIAAEQHARALAFQDPLTGLANRRQFDQALNAAI